MKLLLILNHCKLFSVLVYKNRLSPVNHDSAGSQFFTY